MNKCGIYQIENTANGKVYIGRAVDIAKRWGEHRYNLKNDQHANSHLQHAFDKYGKSAFKFAVIEECSKKDIVDRESFHIMSFPTEMTYNKDGDYGNGVVEPGPEARENMSKAQAGREITAEHRAKLSKASSDYYSAPENRAKTSRALMGNKNALGSRGNCGQKLSTKHKAKISAAMKGRLWSATRKRRNAVTSETRAKMSAVRKGKPWSPARRAAQEVKNAAGAASRALRH